MDMDTTAYLNDIKKYEDALARDPRSLCFAPLSDVYRKIGRLDDALEIALKGCETHPGYIGGYMALGRACFEKGLYQESRQALEKVVDAMPGNLLAHKLLDEVCGILGDSDAAARSEAVVRSFSAQPEPELPSELPAELEEPTFALPVDEPAEAVWSAFAEETGAVHGPGEMEDDEEIIDLLDVVTDEEEVILSGPGPDVTEGTVAAAAHVSPLSTVTIAELYVSQGFTDRALGIYEEILAADPENADVQQRIDTLRQRLEAEKTADEVPAAAETVVPEISVQPEEDTYPAGWGGAPFAMATAMAGAGELPGEKTAPDQANVLETLEGWLENIRRMR